MSSKLVGVKSRLTSAFKRCVQSVKPGPLVREALKVDGNRLLCRGKEFTLRQNVTLVGFGKAALEMTKEAENILGHHITKGALSIPKGTGEGHGLPAKYQVFEGAQNNLPDEDAVMAATHIHSLVEGLSQSDVLLVLISGGGSALLPLPTPPVTLSEKLEVIKRLVSRGADIKELNTVRRGLSRVKGGRLAAAAHPATVISLLLSDVIGDPLVAIASGPTTPPSHSSSPLKVLDKYGLLHDVPSSVIEVLSNEKPVGFEVFRNVSNHIIGNNLLALNKCKDFIEKEGVPCVLVSSAITGFVHDLAKHYVNLSSILYHLMTQTIDANEGIKRLKTLKEPLCTESEHLTSLSKAALGADKLILLFGGEPTVKLQGYGVGGRSQELALRFSIAAEALEGDLSAVLLCGGTDGIDGPTDAAGAIGYKGLLTDAKAAGLCPIPYLNWNDSYSFLSQLSKGENLLKVGPTGTNVMDIHILYLSKHKL